MNKTAKTIQISSRMEAIQLRWQETSREIVISPEDQDRFTATVEEAIKACQSSIQGFAKFQQAFKSLLTRLQSWISEHEKDVDSAYLSVRDAGLLFVVVRKGASYDRDFEDLLTQVDLEIANDSEFNTIRMNVLALPNCPSDSITAFVSPEYAISLSSPVS